MDARSPLALMRAVLEQEAAGVTDAIGSLCDAHVTALEWMRSTPGKVVITGVGKSGIVGRKIAATMSSTGTTAVFLHAAEALHGDLGVVCAGDVVIAISKSGESDELRLLAPAIRRMGARLVALTERPDSTLGHAADLVLPLPRLAEACPHDLAPTVSSTVTLAVGDALALALMQLKDFQSTDFAVRHPAGALGRRLLQTVADVMVPVAQCAVLAPSAPLQEVIVAMSSRGHGVALFAAQDGALAGILTDGDLRRLMQRLGRGLFDATAADWITRRPFTLEPRLLAADALLAMEGHAPPLNVAPIVDAAGVCVGIVRLHDLLGGAGARR